LYEKILNEKPDIIGFSIWGQNPLTFKVIKKLKSNSSIPIIIGGPFTVKYGSKKIAFEHLKIDFLINAMGDVALPKLIHMIENNKLKKTSNICYKDGNKIKDGGIGTIDLNNIPSPDFSQFDFNLFFTPIPLLPLQTARGCTWKKCAFCTHFHIYGNNYFKYDTSKFIDILNEHREKYKTNLIMLHDDTLSPQRAKEISEAILKEKIDDVYFYCYARLDDGFTKNILKTMYKAGFSTIHWGMESGCQRTLDNINKGTKVETMEKVLKNSFDSGISNLCFVFFGFPGETKKEAMETISFLKRNSKYIDFHSIGSFKLEKNSMIWKNPEKWGLAITNENSPYNYKLKYGMQPLTVKKFTEEITNKIQSGKLLTYQKRFVNLPGYIKRPMYFIQSAINRDYFKI